MSVFERIFPNISDWLKCPLTTLSPELVRRLYLESHPVPAVDGVVKLSVLYCRNNEETRLNNFASLYHGAPLPKKDPNEVVVAPIWSFTPENTSLKPTGYMDTMGLIRPARFDLVVLNNYLSLASQTQITAFWRAYSRYFDENSVFITWKLAIEKHNPLYFPPFNRFQLRTIQNGSDEINILTPQTQSP